MVLSKNMSSSRWINYWIGRQSKDETESWRKTSTEVICTLYHLIMRWNLYTFDLHEIEWYMVKCIVLYLTIYKAPLTVWTIERRSQCRSPGERETSSGNEQMWRRTQTIVLPAEGRQQQNNDIGLEQSYSKGQKIQSVRREHQAKRGSR